MQKWWIAMLLVCMAWPSAAQGNFLKNVGKAVEKQTNGALLRQARVGKGKILLGKEKMPSVQASDVEKYIFKGVVPTAPAELFPELDQLFLGGGFRSYYSYRGAFKESSGSEAHLRIFNQYREVMESFLELKKELDVFLYYQSKPSERRALFAGEKATLSQKIIIMERKLESLKFSIPYKDRAYDAAVKYILYAAKKIDPALYRYLVKDKEFRSDREYVKDEFYLRTPVGGASLVDQFFKGEEGGAYKWPKGLRVAVLNDDASVLEKVQSINAGELGPQWNLVEYTSVEKLYRDIYYNRQQFDMILMDIILPDGNGVNLAAELRYEGYNGIILGLAAVAEEYAWGERMFKEGFDGMISVPESFGKEKGVGPLSQRVLQKIRNYFYYRDLKNWIR